MISPRPSRAQHDLVTRALGPSRLVGDLGVALGHTVHELPHLITDLRGLVRELHRAAQPDGELMRLLDSLARLADARAARERASVAEAV